ncbi:MAG: D-amino acid aminotransferase [Firmicutes bacterium]|nr:D-amino acid aminotransferase [Bacillota bacterium]MDD4264374.1 D-amino acid aminotransferase [Bacillota bacterium]MDD4693015.1 D-amino acid aminotransferase [Bacillota bacterium]
MERIFYVNGKYLPASQAVVSAEDRGFNFGDGVYEVVHWYNYQPFLLEEHVERLIQSASVIKIDLPWSKEELIDIAIETAKQNNLKDDYIYMQISRGAAIRQHSFPDSTQPTLVMNSQPSAKPAKEIIQKGARVITIPDIRWLHCDIKALSALANVLAKQAAKEHSVDDVLYDRAGVGVVEGGSSNIFYYKEGKLYTPPLSPYIFPGITRAKVIEVAKECNIPLEEKVFSLKEVLDADEVMLASTGYEVLSVTEVNGQKIGRGVPGDISKELLQTYTKHVKEACY